MLGLGESFTKYHGRREKIATVSIPGRATVKLGLSDTHRCAKSIDSAKQTVQNIAGELVPVGKVEEEAQLLHTHCRGLLGLFEDPAAARR